MSYSERGKWEYIVNLANPDVSGQIFLGLRSYDLDRIASRAAETYVIEADDIILRVNRKREAKPGSF